MLITILITFYLRKKIQVQVHTYEKWRIFLKFCLNICFKASKIFSATNRKFSSTSKGRKMWNSWEEYAMTPNRVPDDLARSIDLWLDSCFRICGGKWSRKALRYQGRKFRKVKNRGNFVNSSFVKSQFWKKFHWSKILEFFQ